jgi:ribonucleoside-diphosphate reductase alpha chain
MDDAHFTAPIARHIWDVKYRYREGAEVYDATVADTWQRIAHALAAADSDKEVWQGHFYDILQDFKFLPGGRI